jgi:transposase
MDQTLINQVISWREGRRLRAYELHQHGWKQKDIAAALGVTPGAVSQWLKRAREEGGIVALRRRPIPGPQARLTPEHLSRLPALLAQGAEAFGFRGQVWTHPRVAALIEQQFGVRYHPTHAGRLLQQVGWTPQKPVVRATQRNEEAIQTWRTERWPALKQTRRPKDERWSS